MTSPKSLKRSFDDANLENLPRNPLVIPENHEGPSAMLMTKMPADQGNDPAPSVDSSRLSSPAPSHASSSAVRDATVQALQHSTASAPTSKNPKLTFAEKEVKRMEKEFKDREKAEEKARKEQEKETRDRQKVEEKAKKEEEKRTKDLERETKRLIQEEKNNVKEEEKRKRDEEKARKEEEKNKKAKSQLRLNAFFALPSLPIDGSRESPALDGQSPSSSRRSSIASLHGSGAISGERSISTTPKKAQMPDYEKLFPSFFVKAHTRLALWNRFSQDEGGTGDTSAKFDRFLSHDGSSSVANTTSALRTEFDLKLLNTHLRRRLPRRGAQLPVKEIVARLNGTAINPVDLTNPVPQKAVQNPINMLKAIPTKFLKFAEDVRPPYIGTYTKALEGRTTTKLSRNPFVRALPLTDYDYDSEAEWEEPEEGEDLDSEGEEEVEEDDGEDMEGFLDDRDADEVKKRRPIIGDLEPTCTGLCWEDSQSNIHRFGTIGHSLDLTPFRLDIILDNHSLPIDPYSTSYWQPLSSIVKNEASPSRMDPPRIPLNAINRLNLQLPNPLPQDGTKPNSTPSSIATLAKAAKQAQIKRYIAPDLLEGFKAAVKGSDLTKLGLVEVLKKQFPKQSKSAIQDTLTLVAERIGGKESEKRWVMKETT